MRETVQGTDESCCSPARANGIWTGIHTIPFEYATHLAGKGFQTRIPLQILADPLGLQARFTVYVPNILLYVFRHMDRRILRAWAAATRLPEGAVQNLRWD